MIDTNWHARARCRDWDPELFFPVGDGPESRDQARVAKSVCAACPVRHPCLTYALESGEVGVWGGTTDDERRAMRRQSGRSVPKDRRPAAA